MNNRTAKQLRKEIYGDSDYRDRKYYKIKKTGQVIADLNRKRYQQLKENYSRRLK